MKCFLHIGTEKTATTTIQNFLNSNREKLLKDGVFYTQSTGKINNRKLPVAAYDVAYRDDYTRTLGIETNKDLINHQNTIVKELKHEILKKLERYPDFEILFSSEHLQSRLTSLGEINRLKEILVEVGVTEIYVLVYLRNPAEIANSLYSTGIKCGGISPSPPPPDNPYYNNICSHKKTLQNFSSVFGEHAVIPRIFDKSMLKNGSILEDFLDVLGIHNVDQFTIPDNHNESLSQTGLSLLRNINEIVPRFNVNKPNPLRGDIVKYIEKYYSAGKYVMPRYLFEQYDSYFQESNEWVRENYFPYLASLFPFSAEKKETHTDIAEEEIKILAKLIANIWLDKQRRIVKLKNGKVT